MRKLTKSYVSNQTIYNLIAWTKVKKSNYKIWQKLQEIEYYNKAS